MNAAVVELWELCGLIRLQ